MRRVAMVVAAAAMVGGAVVMGQVGPGRGGAATKPANKPATKPATNPSATQKAWVTVPAYIPGTATGLTAEQVRLITAGRKVTDEDMLNQRFWGSGGTYYNYKFSAPAQAMTLEELLALEVDPKEEAVATGQIRRTEKDYLMETHWTFVPADRKDITSMNDRDREDPFFDLSYAQAGMYSPYAAATAAIAARTHKAIEQYRKDLADPDVQAELKPVGTTFGAMRVSMKLYKGMPHVPGEKPEDVAVQETFTPVGLGVVAERVVRYAPEYGYRPRAIQTMADGKVHAFIMVFRWANIGTATAPEWYVTETWMAEFQPEQRDGQGKLLPQAGTRGHSVMDIEKIQRVPVLLTYPWTPGARTSAYPRLPADLATKPGNHQKD